MRLVQYLTHTHTCVYILEDNQDAKRSILSTTKKEIEHIYWQTYSCNCIFIYKTWTYSLKKCIVRQASRDIYQLNTSIKAKEKQMTRIQWSWKKRSHHELLDTSNIMFHWLIYFHPTCSPSSSYNILQQSHGTRKLVLTVQQTSKSQQICTICRRTYIQAPGWMHKHVQSSR